MVNFKSIKIQKKTKNKNTRDTQDVDVSFRARVLQPLQVHMFGTFIKGCFCVMGGQVRGAKELT